jgi:hypothetical protein
MHPRLNDCMKSSIRVRVKRLEARTKARTIPPFRSGYLTRLPEEYTGERHVIIVRSEPDGLHGEWCEFEERPGPAPPGSHDGGFRVYCTKEEGDVRPISICE